MARGGTGGPATLSAVSEGRWCSSGEVGLARKRVGEWEREGGREGEGQQKADRQTHSQSTSGGEGRRDAQASEGKRQRKNDRGQGQFSYGRVHERTLYTTAQVWAELYNRAVVYTLLQHGAAAGRGQGRERQRESEREGRKEKLRLQTHEERAQRREQDRREPIGAGQRGKGVGHVRCGRAEGSKKEGS